MHLQIPTNDSQLNSLDNWNDEIILSYLNEMLTNGTPDEFVQALNTVARAKKYITLPKSLALVAPLYTAVCKVAKCVLKL